MTSNSLQENHSTKSNFEDGIYARTAKILADFGLPWEHTTKIGSLVDYLQMSTSIIGELQGQSLLKRFRGIVLLETSR
jgi:hypothetical protein